MIRYFTIFLALILFSQFSWATFHDGKIISKHKYVLPPFETSGFRQTPEIKQIYENQLGRKLEGAKKTTDIDTIEYSSDGLKVRGFILKPRNVPSASRFPILVYNRGGSGDYDRLDVNNIIWLSKLAQKGYLVVASQYRGNDGERGADEFGGNDVHDVLNLIKLAKGQREADPSNIFISGHSRGGMESYLTMKADSEINAAAILSGECDLAAGLIGRPNFEKNVYEEFIPHYRERKAQELTARSACSWPQDIHAPVYILQGSDDMSVDPGQAQEMAEKLGALGKPFKLEMFPGGHNFWFFDKFSDEIINKIDKWFRSYRSK